MDDFQTSYQMMLKAERSRQKCGRHPFACLWCNPF